MNEPEIVPTIFGCNFIDNERSSLQYTSFAAASTIEQFTFIRSPLVINDKWSTNDLTLKTCYFQHNYRQANGAVSISSTGQRSNKGKLLNANKLIFDGCQFINNSLRNGAGIYATSIQQLTIDSCSFFNCVASENGGCIYTSAETEIKNSNFSSTSASKGAAIYARLDHNIKISNIVLDFVKKRGQAAIYVTGSDSSKSLTFDGNGCFISSNREANDETPDFIESDSAGSIVFKGTMCFSETLSHSVKVPSNVNLNEEWFQCKDCSAPAPPTTAPTIQPPTLPPTQPPASGDASASFTQPVSGSGGNPNDSSSKSKSKLSAGAIAGIVIAIIVVIVLIILLVILLLRKKSVEKQPDVTSQEIASDNFSMSQENPIWSEEISNERPIYNPSIDNPSFESPVNEDPFIKDFEEGF